MKFSSLSLALLLLLALPARAQFVKGDIFLGGGFDISVRSSEQNLVNNPSVLLPLGSTSSFQVSPSVGVLVSEKLAIGGSIGLSFFSFTNDSSFGISEQDDFTLVGGPFIRYYVPVQEKLGFFLDMGVRAGGGNSTRRSGFGGAPDERKFSIFQLDMAIRPAFYFFATPRLALEASFGSLGYDYLQYTPKDQAFNTEDASSSTFNFSLRSSLGIGLRYFLRKGDAQ